MDIIQIIGVVGSAIILIGFVMLEHRKWLSESKAYLLSNCIGSLLLALYAFILKSYPFIILNGIFVLVSVKKLWELRTKK